MQWPKPLLRDNPNVSKNDFGHVLVVAGSASMLGAATLVGLAAMRSGAGLVTCAIPSHLNLALQKKLSPVVMTLPYKTFNDIKKMMEKFNVVALGPGLGVSKFTQKLVNLIISKVTVPIVLDADALNIIATSPNIFLESNTISVVTPHFAEMARMSNISIKDIKKNPKQVAFDFSRKYNCIVVLKSHKTIVVDPSGRVYQNTTGNSKMATAGSGDILTGMITALIAQKVKPFEAASFGVYWHGKAGDRFSKASKKFMIATDLLDYL